MMNNMEPVNTRTIRKSEVEEFLNEAFGEIIGLHLAPKTTYYEHPLETVITQLLAMKGYTLRHY